MQGREGEISCEIPVVQVTLSKSRPHEFFGNPTVGLEFSFASLYQANFKVICSQLCNAIHATLMILIPIMEKNA